MLLCPVTLSGRHHSLLKSACLDQCTVMEWERTGQCIPDHQAGNSDDPLFQHGHVETTAALKSSEIPQKCLCNTLAW